jgi:tRNA-splicing ligase RtcB (3'-phosphate/5'-hydroxy nucleic acid ligase)
MRVITTERVPIKLWLNDIEQGALDQALNLANLPFIFKHLAIMPDSHQGYGMPIGGVLATKNIIIPNAVGVDIGCGMCAVETSLVSITKSDLQKIVDKIKEIIPVGFSHQKEKQDEELMPQSYSTFNLPVVSKEYNSALKQLGTLGGGNHFIEIQKGNDDHIWIMIHSGSRNLGKQVADSYNKIAIRLNGLWFSEVTKDKELAFLPIQTDDAKDYINEMNYCVEFALANRRLMMERIKWCFSDVVSNIKFRNMINIAHNYAKWEHHFGHDVVIHRKGATSARIGEIGIIPGSMGTKSYIVEGLGNPESFMSCSHGTGRKMGRKQAQRELNLKHEIEIMENQGIIHGIKTIENLDEAVSAYKDIDIVMENQKDLVKILVELKPLAVIKG